MFTYKFIISVGKRTVHFKVKPRKSPRRRTLSSYKEMANVLRLCKSQRPYYSMNSWFPLRPNLNFRVEARYLFFSKQLKQIILRPCHCFWLPFLLAVLARFKSWQTWPNIFSVKARPSLLPVLCKKFEARTTLLFKKTKVRPCLP